MKNKKGFTLIELLGIIAILAVIMVIAVPQIIKIFSNSTDNTWNNSVNGIENALSKNIQVVNPITGKYKYTVEEFCSNPTKLDEIVDYKNIDITCKDNTFTLKGNGQLKDRTAIIECSNLQCDLLKQNSDGTQIAGLYDKDDNLLATWKHFVSSTGFDVTEDKNKGFIYLNGNYYKAYNRSVDGTTSNQVIYVGYDPSTVKPSNIVDISSVPDNVLVKILNDNYQSVKKIVLPSDTKTIGFGAFAGCYQIENVVLPNSLERIREYAFAWSGINNIRIPAKYDKYGTYPDVFKGCTKLRRIDVEEGNSLFNSIDGVMFEEFAGRRTLLIYPSGKEDAEYIVPNGVTHLNSYSFAGNKHIKSVKLPTSVSSISISSFESCSSLTNVEMTENIKTIGVSAFEDSGLKNIEIPNSVMNIGFRAFFKTELQSAVFLNASGWKAKDVDLDSSNLSNDSIAAIYLKDTYTHDNWTRSN